MHPIYAVILAGGSGTRFWPKSTLAKPKQLLTMGGAQSCLLAQTLERLDGFIPENQRYIVTRSDQADAIAHAVGSQAQLICEPEAKNTAAALALAAYKIYKHNPEGLMVSLHADHLISTTAEFRHTIEIALKVCEQNYLTLIGIKPTHAETGYGYMEKGEQLPDGSNHKVAAFHEKPDESKAQYFLKEGHYLWNSGIFVWPVALLIQELRRYLPDTCNKLESLTLHNYSDEKFSQVYASLESIAIDHAILEKSQKVACVEASFQWNDIGSWNNLDRCFAPDTDGNLNLGTNYMDDCQNLTIDSENGPFVAAIGIKDSVIVTTEKAVLVCAKNQAQQVKQAVAYLHASGRIDLL